MSSNTLPAYDEELPFETCLINLKKIDELVGVSEGYKSACRAVALRFMSYQDRFRCFYAVAQLSEFGTGWNSSFENGNAQSKRRDDVQLDFITSVGGTRAQAWLIGWTIKFCVRTGAFESAWTANVDFKDLDHLLRIVDAAINFQWTNGAYHLAAADLTALLDNIE